MSWSIQDGGHGRANFLMISAAMVDQVATRAAIEASGHRPHADYDQDALRTGQRRKALRQPKVWEDDAAEKPAAAKEACRSKLEQVGKITLDEITVSGLLMPR